VNRISGLMLVALFIIVAATAAYGARPVARWDVVPDQRIDSAFNVGVVAFHVEGVEVEFRVNGTLVHTAPAPTLNPRTGVWEFWFALDPTAYADGPVTVTARAICLNNIAANPAYDLPSLNLYANTGGTLGSTVVKWADAVGGLDTNPGTEAAPYQTLNKAVSNTPPGGTVYLKAGVYSGQAMGGGNTRAYWTTVAAAEGLGWDDVEISEGRPSTDRLRLKNLSIFTTNTSGGYATILMGENGGNVIWLDNVKAWNKNGRYAASTVVFGNRYGAYVTGGLTTEVANGTGGSIIRGHTLDTITSDAFTGGGRLVVNSSCDGIDPGTTGAHPDFHQSYAVAPDFVENVILYNVRGYACKSQGLFGSRLRNSAFVNVLFERTTDTVMNSQYSGPVHNVLFLHMNIINQTWLWREADFDAEDVHVINSVFGSMSTYNNPPLDGLYIDTNHFSGSSNMGTNVTTGSPEYVSPAGRDYRLLATSPARGTGLVLQCVPADIDGTPYHASSPNRGCYAGGGTIQLLAADAGPDQTIADADANGFEVVTLDGTASLPRQGQTITGYLWREGLALVGTNAVQIAVLTTGTHTLTLEVTQDDGAKATDDVVITVAGEEDKPGDADGDGDVDLDDFVILKQNFGMSSGATVSEGDFDGDGDVDLEDFVILKQNFGTGG
jgi:hypothetical protein